MSWIKPLMWSVSVSIMGDIDMRPIKSYQWRPQDYEGCRYCASLYLIRQIFGWPGWLFAGWLEKRSFPH